MGRRGQVIGAWAGPLGIVLFGIGIGPLAADFLPPLAPSMPDAEVAAFYRDHADGIRLAAILMIAASACFGAFTGALTALVRRIEGPSSPYAYAQLGGGLLATVGFLVPALIWAVAPFRAERSASDIALLNDLAWIILVMPAWVGTLQYVAVGLAIFEDRSPDPLLPRWLGFLSVWTGILVLPGLLVAYFQHGPFAWNGLLGFWLPAVAFTVWLGAMCHCMLKAARR